MVSNQYYYDDLIKSNELIKYYNNVALKSVDSPIEKSMLDEVHNKLSIAMKKHEFSCLPANAIGLPINLIAILNETTLNIDLVVNVYIGKVMFERKY